VKLPDGLLEVLLAKSRAPDVFILEITAYADRQVFAQVQRDVALVYAQRKIVPEVLVIVLRPKGQVEIGPSHALTSRLGWTRWETSWRVVQLWEVPEEELWTLDDPGIIPWIPLSKSDRAPETVVEQCRKRIEQQAPAEERENLLAVTQIFTWLRFKDKQLLQRLGGRKMIAESELVQEIVEELVEERAQKRLAEAEERLREQVGAARTEGEIKAIMTLLEDRFGELPEDLPARLRELQDEAKVTALVRTAARCRDVAAFETELGDGDGRAG
jgi:hypothetical protein